MAERGAPSGRARALLDRWDALDAKGEFPAARSDDVRIWDGCVTAFASATRWLLIFETVGFSYLSASAQSWVTIVEDEKATGKRETLWRATASLVDQPRFGRDYTVPDPAVETFAVSDDYAAKGDDFAHLKEFVVEFEGFERTVRPSLDDYRLGGAEVPRSAYEKNAIGERIDLLRGALVFGESEVWLEDPLAELSLRESYPDVELVHRERGFHVLRHLESLPGEAGRELLRPSRLPLWQGLAAKLVRDSSAARGPIDLPDPTTQAVAEALGALASELDSARLASVTELHVGSRRDVEQIDLAARMPNLEKAYLFGSRVSDLRPLERCQKLDEVSAPWTGVVSVEPIAGLPKLRRVDVSGTEVLELSPFASPRLEDLRISFTEIDDLWPLANARGLSTFIADGTSVSDLSPLASIPTLRFVSLAGTPVSDLSPLAKLSLGRLDVSFTALKELSVLKKIPGLHWVQARGIADVSALLDLPQLREASVGPGADPGVVAKLEKKGVRLG